MLFIWFKEMDDRQMRSTWKFRASYLPYFVPLFTIARSKPPDGPDSVHKRMLNGFVRKAQPQGLLMPSRRFV